MPGDLHSALKTSEVARANGAGVEFLLMQLQDGKDLFRYSLHCHSSTWSSWGLQTTDMLAMLGFRRYNCPFLRMECWAIDVGPVFDVAAFAEAFTNFHGRLQAAEGHLEACGYFLHQQRYGDRAAGDGHTSPMAEHKEDAEDESFLYRFSWIDGGRDKGWITHYQPKNEPVSPEILAVMQLLDIRSFISCPELDFDACFWRFTAFQNDGRSPFDSNADHAYRWFRQHAEHFSPGIENFLEAHALVEPFGFRLLPTMPSLARRITDEVQKRVERPTREAAPSSIATRSPITMDGFDVAISFAGTERAQAEQLATALRDAGYSVFYDNFFKAQLWGKNLTAFFDDIYRKSARFCVLFVSKEYADRVWTNHELQSAQARALQEKGKEYILPIRVDDTDLLGLPPNIGYISLSEGVEAIAAMLMEKLQA